MIKARLRGLTLVEMIIGVAILGIILAALYSFFIQNYKISVETYNTARIEGEAKRLSDSLRQWFEMADQRSINVSVSSAGDKIVEMDVYEAQPAASGAVAGTYHVKVTWVSASKSVVIEKTGSSPYQILTGRVTFFDSRMIAFGTIKKVEVEYEVFVTRRASMDIKRKYKVSHVLRTE
ncbi:PilW family protein [Caldicellulosiruptor morganii]|uniref:Prepilin-type N-terminal cleavage/methylation domain-containing protein n=1 Tax=Caldicellulosiruptor morganii TaxID=1387555 RepID=A0ABY7BMT8_9FIRM|nr:prepilin-type N-terminal cleavage/methylation domain-containing protein [Caldicellulosiruptor morganii]WAM33197.1 prepilin-type N-terminal cleavage/methylation domain-containing protein [Caldicellulosiruptor morganii]